jgi:hypothetical protein
MSGFATFHLSALGGQDRLGLDVEGARMNDPGSPTNDGKKEACKTYLEQIKLLVTLSSAFLFAPAGLIAILKDKPVAGLTHAQFAWFVVAEIFFIVSVLAGYVAVGGLAGSQDEGDFDVFRPAIRFFSLVQFGFYVLGLVVFVFLAITLLK